MYETVAGSSTFQVILIHPGTSVIKASPRLCMCKECKNEFGSCSLYKEYDLTVHHLNKVSSRSNFVNEYTPDCEGAGTAKNEFIAKDSVVAVAARNKHTDTIWFLMVTSNEMIMNKSINGGYGNTTAAGQDFFTGKFLERTTSQTVYVLSNKNIDFFEKSFVYPFDQVIPNKKSLHYN